MTNIYKTYINELVIYKFPSEQLIRFIESNNEDDGINVLLNNIVWFITNNHFDLLKPLYGQNPDLIKYNNWDVVRCAASNGYLDTLKYMHSITDISDGIKSSDWYAVRRAASNGHLDILEYFHSIMDISDGIKARDWGAVRYAAYNGNLDTLKYLHSLKDISDGLKACYWDAVREANTEMKQWIKTTFPELMKQYKND